MRRYIFALLLLCTGLSASAVRFKGRVGYNIGGTLPLGIPAEVREVLSYDPSFGLTIGVDVLQPFEHSRWTLNTGLRVVNLKMNSSVRVKNYATLVKIGNQELDGRFTGTSDIHADLVHLQVPLQMEYQLLPKLSLRAGGYLGVKLKGDFNGTVYDGYHRKGNPTGERIDITSDNKAHYDFSGDLRPFSLGVLLGIDYAINQNLGVYAEGSWGQTNIFKPSFSAVSFSLYPIHGTIGLSYKL